MMNHSLPHNSQASFGKRKPLGQLLSEAGLISAQQIEIALREQAEIPDRKIGEIMALRGWLKQKTADFFVEQWHDLVKQEQKYPLIHYLQQAALLDKDQIDFVLKQRNNSPEKLRFHHIAVKHGLIKQQTVDFFIKNLLGSVKSKNSSKSTTTPYDLLKNYVRGETDFQGAKLARIKLNHVTLKGINLNNSDLTEAELKQANLSNSSFKFADLTNANLEKAILNDVDFEYARLERVNLTDAHLEGANFKQADLRQADLRHGYLVKVCFQGADLRNTRLKGANLQDACYDLETSFDANFDPAQMGMKLV
ncbi:pentapeptide repeat-containing protein [Pleurocapsales cyanobacterium LEGE 10410]|nr:pentapeptide repeat-containing protein [Pleurocapsales cyanobacterium LEGE 10410]